MSSPCYMMASAMASMCDFFTVSVNVPQKTSNHFVEFPVPSDEICDMQTLASRIITVCVSPCFMVYLQP